ncbi:MAG: hypothetical protein ACOZB0_09715 [Pseudomonadota bacterium]
MQSFARLILWVAAAVSCLLLVASYYFFTGFSEQMMKKSAYQQADTIAQITFSSMYQLMSQGWKRDQVITFADHAAASVANTPTRITFYRAEPVSRQYGAVNGQALDAEAQAALESGRPRQVDGDKALTYHLPLVAQDNCLRCHSQAKRGDVLGLITVRTEFGDRVKENRLHMLLVLVLLAPLPFVAALLVAVHLDRRFEDFAAGLGAVEADMKAGHPADFSKVPVNYREFQDVLTRIRGLFK